MMRRRRGSLSGISDTARRASSPWKSGVAGADLGDNARYAVRTSASALSLVTFTEQAYAAASVRSRATRARFAWSSADTIVDPRQRQRRRFWALGRRLWPRR